MTRLVTGLLIATVVAGLIGTTLALTGWATASPPVSNRTLTLTDQRAADLISEACVAAVLSKFAIRDTASGDWENAIDRQSRGHSRLRSAIHAIGLTDAEIIERALDRDPNLLRDIIDAKLRP